MSFELDKEKVMDVLIWWIEGTDGSIDYREDEAVRRVLKDMDYSLDTFYEDTLMHISGLSNEKMSTLIDKSIEWGSKRYDGHQKKHALALLGNIAASNGNITNGQQKKLDKIKGEFGV